MTPPPLIIGVSAGDGARAALALGTLAARAAGGTAIVTHIVPETWDHPSPARVDAEYAAFLREKAQIALDRARTMAPAAPGLRFAARAAASPQAGLAALARAEHAWAIVIGPAAGAPDGHVAEGPVASALIDSAPCPVFLAPAGYGAGYTVPATAPTTAPIPRVTCCISGSARSAATARAAARLAARLGAPMRLLTLVADNRQTTGPIGSSPGGSGLGGSGPGPSLVGYDAENMVTRQFRAQAEAAHAAIRAAWPADCGVAAPDSLIAEGTDWAASLARPDWLAGELLVVGPCRSGPVTRFFFGSDVGTIVRAAPLPCVVLPHDPA